MVRLREAGRGRRILLEEAPFEPAARPFLKWAGGKQWLVPLASAFVPEDFDGRYYEPFLGAAALFFALSPRRATLSDSNDDLAATYSAIRDDPDGTIEELRSYPYSREFFDDLRQRKPRSARARAARLIYLNRTAFNGLYRVSRAGNFNVPFGRYANPTICNEKRLRAAAKVLKGATISGIPFTQVAGRPRRGDFIYLDPPYITGHQNNGFHKYNARLFAWPDQTKLAELARDLSQRGVRVVVSNADHPAVVDLYSGLHAYRVARRSAIGGGLDYRGHVRELLFTNFPLFDVETEKVP